MRTTVVTKNWRTFTVRGFTLIELLIVLAVAGIGLAIVAPTFSTSTKNSRLTVAVNELVASIHLARSEASKRGVPVTICTSNQTDQINPACVANIGWDQGWLIIADNSGLPNAPPNTLIKSSKPLANGLFMVNSNDLNSAITFQANGFASGLNANNNGNRYFVVCDATQDNQYSRALSISNAGRPQIVDREESFHTPPTCSN